MEVEDMSQEAFETLAPQNYSEMDSRNTVPTPLRLIYQ